jgi:hypothetical protein
MSIWRARRYQVQAAAGIVLALGDDYSLALHQVVLVFVPGGVSGTPRR